MSTDLEARVKRLEAILDRQLHETVALRRAVNVLLSERRPGTYWIVTARYFMHPHSPLAMDDSRFLYGHACVPTEIGRENIERALSEHAVKQRLDLVEILSCVDYQESEWQDDPHILEAVTHARLYGEPAFSSFCSEDIWREERGESG